MKLNNRQKEYIKKYLSLNLGSDTTLHKEDIIKFAEELGLQFKKNISKSNLIELISSSKHEEHFYNVFAEFINVPYWEIHKQFNISYKQINELEQLGIIESLDYKAKGNVTLYPIEVLGFQDGELLKIWNDKYKTDFYRTRIEIKKLDDFQKLINEFSKVFEIENVSKAYEHREQKGYYCYFSIRPLSKRLNNDNHKNRENAKLKVEIGTLKSEIEKLQETITDFESSSTDNYFKSPQYKNMRKQLENYQDFYLMHKFSDNEIKKLTDRIKELENHIEELTDKQNKKHPGGRPPKFSAQDKAIIRKYRLEGKKIKELAEMFNCSVGIIHKLVNENNNN